MADALTYIILVLALPSSSSCAPSSSSSPLSSSSSSSSSIWRRTGNDRRPKTASLWYDSARFNACYCHRHCFFIRVSGAPPRTPAPPPKPLGAVGKSISWGQTHATTSTAPTTTTAAIKNTTAGFPVLHTIRIVPVIVQEFWCSPTDTERHHRGFRSGGRGNVMPSVFEDPSAARRKAIGPPSGASPETVFCVLRTPIEERGMEGHGEDRTSPGRWCMPCGISREMTGRGVKPGTLIAFEDITRASGKTNGRMIG